jgi:hypothetical protein
MRRHRRAGRGNHQGGARSLADNGRAAAKMALARPRRSRRAVPALKRRGPGSMRRPRIAALRSENPPPFVPSRAHSRLRRIARCASDRAPPWTRPAAAMCGDLKTLSGVAAGLVHCGSQGKTVFQRRDSLRCRCSPVRTRVQFQRRASLKRVAPIHGHAAPSARASDLDLTHKMPAAPLSRSRRSWWRRRELNPSPQGVQSTFIHVRSR